MNEQLLNCGSTFKLPKYKFFTNLVDELLFSMKQFGTNINSFLPEIKKALISDMRFEMKIRREFQGAIFQMFFVQIFGIIFITSMHIQLSRDFILEEYLPSLILQVIGYSLFIIIFSIIKVKTFKDLDSYISSLYQIRILTCANIPLKDIHNRVGLNELKEDKLLSPIKKRIFQIMSQIKNTGHLSQDDIETTIEEIWFINEFKFEQFLRHLSALKLLVIVIFFLSSFMLILLQVLESLAV